MMFLLASKDRAYKPMLFLHAVFSKRGSEINALCTAKFNEDGSFWWAILNISNHNSRNYTHALAHKFIIFVCLHTRLILHVHTMYT